jgi:hypothetical protein
LRFACLRRVQVFALDIENSVPACAIILERDLRAQLHRLFFGKLFAQTRIQIVLPHSFEVKAFGVRFKCLDLPTLIRIKEAAGGPRDREAIAELRVLLQETEQRQS